MGWIGCLLYILMLDIYALLTSCLGYRLAFFSTFPLPQADQRVFHLGGTQAERETMSQCSR